MVDFLLCDCCWISLAWTGLALQLCCYGCWICRPQLMGNLHPHCCTKRGQTGLGCSLFCVACVSCLPNWLRTYILLKDIPLSIRTNSRVSYPRQRYYPVLYK